MGARVMGATDESKTTGTAGDQNHFVISSQVGVLVVVHRRIDIPLHALGEHGGLSVGIEVDSFKVDHCEDESGL